MDAASLKPLDVPAIKSLAYIACERRQRITPVGAASGRAADNEAEEARRRPERCEAP